MQKFPNLLFKTEKLKIKKIQKSDSIRVFLVKCLVIISGIKNNDFITG